MTLVTPFLGTQGGIVLIADKCSQRVVANGFDEGVRLCFVSYFVIFTFEPG